MTYRTYTLLAAIALLGLSCRTSALEEAERDRDRLQKSLNSCQAETSDLREDITGLQEDLKDQKHSSEYAMTELCDRFESEAKWSLTPTGVTQKEGGPLLVSQCSEEVAISVRKVTSTGAYLKYTVAGELRYSDLLVFEGKKRDRKAIFIDDIDVPVMVYVAGCHDDACDVECLSLKTEHLTCSNPDIKP